MIVYLTQLKDNRVTAAFKTEEAAQCYIDSVNEPHWVTGYSEEKSSLFIRPEEVME